MMRAMSGASSHGDDESIGEVRAVAKTIPVLHLMFFLSETKNNPKHVSALLLFERPANAGKRFVADLVAEYRKPKPVAPFNLIPRLPLLRMARCVTARKP